MLQNMNAVAQKTWLEVALNGPWTRGRQPGIPVTVKDIVEQGIACVKAGAAIVHLHAYDEAKGPIRVTAAVVPGELWILIADDGFGLRAEGSENRGLGLGLGWMAQFSDGLTLLTRSSGGLEVRLRFDLFEATGEADRSGTRVASFC